MFNYVGLAISGSWIKSAKLKANSKLLCNVLVNKKRKKIDLNCNQFIIMQ